MSRSKFAHFCALMFFSGVVFAQIAVPFTLSPQGHILFNGEINGVKGKFIFDTGVGVNVVTKPFFERLKGLSTNGNYFTGFRATGDRLDVQLYKAKTFSMGAFSYQNPDVTYIDLSWADFDGIISLRNFENVVVSIDYNKKILLIDERSKLPLLKKAARSVVALQIDNSRDIALGIMCRALVNDTLHGQFVLDSGAGSDVFRINARYLGNLDIDVLDSLKVKKIVFASEVKAGHQNVIYLTGLKKISIAGNKNIYKTDLKAQFVEGLIYDGIMSLNWLGKKLSISTASRELLISD